MRWMLGLAFGSAALASGMIGCDTGQACNLLLPSCALAVGLEYEGWEPGTYTFRVSADGKEAECVAELPFSKESAAEFTCSDPGVANLSMFAFDPEIWPRGEWPEAVYVFGSPTRASVAVERSGGAIGAGTFRPRYVTTEPNGEGCGECENARETLVF